MQFQHLHFLLVSLVTQRRPFFETQFLVCFFFLLVFVVEELPSLFPWQLFQLQPTDVRIKHAVKLSQKHIKYISERTANSFDSQLLESQNQINTFFLSSSFLFSSSCRFLSSAFLFSSASRFCLSSSSFCFC